MSHPSPPPTSSPEEPILSLDAEEVAEGLDASNSSSSASASSLITLVSQEGRRLPVTKQALMQSELCKTTIEGDPDASEIPLYHIEAAIVQKVIEYLEYHRKIPPRKIDQPIRSERLSDLVDKWDVQFIEGDEAEQQAQAALLSPSNSTPPFTPSSAASQSVLFKLLLAANYLNIKSLLALCCAKVATLMKGKTPDQIRSVFNIRNDYTQAEEEEVRNTYKDLIG